MPPAHTCARCGRDLSGLRAAADSALGLSPGLSVVVCPSCACPCVRRSGFQRSLPREVNRAHIAVQRMLSAFTLLLVCSLGVPLMVGSLYEELRSDRIGIGEALGALVGLSDPDRDYSNWTSGIGLIVLLIWALACLMAGAYLAAALPHVKRSRVALLWCAVVVGSAALVLSIDAVESEVRRLCYNHGGRPYWAYVLHVQGLWTVILASLPLIAVGIPFGLTIRRSRARFDTRRLRRLRARLIRRRHRA
jgi:hypothetical protein